MHFEIISPMQWRTCISETLLSISRPFWDNMDVFLAHTHAHERMHCSYISMHFETTCDNKRVLLTHTVMYVCISDTFLCILRLHVTKQAFYLHIQRWTCAFQVHYYAFWDRFDRTNTFYLHIQQWRYAFQLHFYAFRDCFESTLPFFAHRVMNVCISGTFLCNTRTFW